MKLFFLFFCLLTISCTTIQKTKKNSQPRKAISKKSNKKSSFEEAQDSLKTILLNSKPNKNLKSSILQELYIKGLVNEIDDKIVFDLKFNLHGFDCGAPDCFSTDITFEIENNTPIQFPKSIDFQLIEYGCDIENEIKVNGIFELVEQSSEYVNYYAKELQSNLIIIGDKKKLYYFPDARRNSIKVNLIASLFEEYDEENPLFTAPYQSTIMTNNDYGNFINKN